MYGFFFMLYSMSNGAIVGLPETDLTPAAPAEPSDNPLEYFLNTATYAITTLWNFFVVLLINPFSTFAWLIPINWAVLGTNVYLFIKMLRGGG